jgi:hypothetical protein
MAEYSVAPSVVTLEALKATPPVGRWAHRLGPTLADSMVRLLGPQKELYSAGSWGNRWDLLYSAVRTVGQ